MLEDMFNAHTKKKLKEAEERHSNIGQVDTRKGGKNEERKEKKNKKRMTQ